MTLGPPMEDRDQWPMFLLFFLFALAFNFDLFLGPYAILRIHDTFDSGFFEFFIRGGLFLKYGLFGWDPHYAGGMPSFANPGVGVLLSLWASITARRWQGILKGTPLSSHQGDR